MQTIPAKTFLRLLQKGEATAEFMVEGSLILEATQNLLAALPDNLQVTTLEVHRLPEDSVFPDGLVCQRLLAEASLLTQFPANVTVLQTLDLSESRELKILPENLQVENLVLEGCSKLKTLPKGLHVNTLHLKSCAQITTIPDSVKIQSKLDLSSCMELDHLPTGLTVGSLVLQNCLKLKALPEGLTVNFLDISDCRNLSIIPESVSIQFGNLIVRGCTQLTELPPNLNLAILDVRGCVNLKSIPESTQIAAYIEIGGSGLTDLPEHLRKVEIRRNGVRINYEIAFHPENITAEAVMAELNAEVRRTMLELMGYERFFAEAEADILFEDHDAGGLRQLLRIEMSGELEPLVVVTYQCPSTSRRYATRVPPDTKTCHQAVAWIAGFDNPDEYQLIAES